MPASNEMRIKSLIYQGFAMPPDVCPGAFLLVKASLRGDAAEQRGELEGAKCPPRMKCTSKA